MPEHDEGWADSTEQAFAALLEESLHDLYEHAPCGYVSTTPDGTIVRVNETFLGWTGFDRDELVGRRRFSDLLTAGDRIYFETHVRPLLHMQDGVREIAAEVVRRGGGRLAVLVNASVRRDESGTPLLVRTTVFDATDRRAYERELLRARRDAEARARAALALAHVADGVLLVDGDGRIRVVNAVAATVLGIDAASSVGALAADEIAGWGDVVDRIPVGTPDLPVPAAVLPLPHAQGERWIAARGVASDEGVVYTIRDVTAERRLDQLRDDLVATVSHELRTPLAGAYGAAITLRDAADRIDAATRAELLEMIVAQTERLSRIVEHVLEAARLDAPGTEASLVPFAAGALVRELVDSYASPAGGIERVATATVEDITARGDAPRLRQALANLVDNALKYAPAPSPVRVGVAVAGGRARFTVVDEGPGIPAAEHANVFEKFYRLDPEQRTGIGGIGLGLYIARELVERMDGHIGLLPTTAGTTFFVDLPLVDG